MVDLKLTYDSAEDVPAEHKALYTETDGKFVFTAIKGLKSEADFAKVHAGLTKERAEHKATKDKLAVWGDLKHDEVVATLERVPELEEAAKGVLDKAKVDEIVARRVATEIKGKLAPIERERDKLKQDHDEARKAIDGFTAKERSRTIRDGVREALVKQKVVPYAFEDALDLAERVLEINEDGKVVTKDGVGLTPGLAPEAWLTDIREKRPHWWPGSQGGGAGGGGRDGGGDGGGNPWSHDGWNMTAQGAYVRKHGMEQAEKLAKSAGTKVGGARPAKKA